MWNSICWMDWGSGTGCRSAGGWGGEQAPGNWEGWVASAEALTGFPLCVPSVVYLFGFKSRGAGGSRGAWSPVCGGEGGA